MSSENNLYSNKFVNVRNDQFNQNNARFQQYMSQQNQNALEQTRLPSKNLKQDLVTQKSKLKVTTKTRTTVININSTNRNKSTFNTLSKNLNIKKNSLSLENSSNKLTINSNSHSLRSGDLVELTGCTNIKQLSNVLCFNGGNITNISTGINPTITTDVNHNLLVNDKIVINKSNTVPSLNNIISNIVSIESNNQFKIDNNVSFVNENTAKYGTSNILINISNHGMINGSNVSISDVNNEIKLNNNPLRLSFDGTNANLIINSPNHDYNKGQNIVINNATKELALGTQPIFISSSEVYESVSNIHITTGSNHNLINNDQVTLENAVVNNVLGNNSLKTLGGYIINLTHAGGVVTITTNGEHKLSVGNIIYLQNTNTLPNINNTAFTITTVTAFNRFTFSKTLRNIFSITGNYGTKIIYINFPNHDFSEGDSIKLSGIEDNTINNNLNTNFTISKVNTGNIQINTSNISNSEEAFGGSNINLGSNYLNYLNKGVSLLNGTYSIIKSNNSNIIVANSNVLVSSSRTIGGNNVILKYNNLYGEVLIDDINGIHQIKSANTNSFIVSIKPSSLNYLDSDFGGGNVIINNNMGIQDSKLNTTHTIPEVIDNNNFIISLNEYSFGKNYNIGGNITLDFNTIAGIKLNKINSKFPLDSDHLQGSLQVNVIDNDNYFVNISEKASQNQTFGTNDIKNTLIENTIQGYPNANNYKVHLDRKYENINKIELISTEFVNSEILIKGSSFSKRQNNIIKWMVFGDDTVYTKELDEGNYDAITFSSMVTNRLSSVIRSNGSTQTIKCSVNIQTGKLTFSHFSHTNLSKAFSITLNTNIINVNHSNHQLSNGDSITISKSTNVGSIPKEEINKTHIITVIDSNTYKFSVISLERIASVNSKGGQTIIIEISSKFKLLLSESKSPVFILGFKEVDTNFAISHTGINMVDLSGDDYFYITSPQLGDTVKEGENIVTNIFAKILLNEAPGNILYDTFVSNPKNYFDTPLKFLEDIEFSLISFDNNPFTVSNFNHSFSIKIEENIEFIENTNFSSRTGKFN
jgi:hypothetical protein